MLRARTYSSGILIVAALLAAGAATAAPPPHSVTACTARLAPTAQLQCAQRAYYHRLGVATVLRHQLARHRHGRSPASAVPLLLQLAHAGARAQLAEAAGWVAEAHRRLLPPWPAHHQLWLCIHGGEGNWDDPNSGGNGHYGGLQMTPSWLGIIPRGHTANEYTQLQQETWAEQGYAASGYSSRWLQGQWGQTVGPCWGYA